ncbi:peptidoglycan DD-metalloendopeptidase family protein [Virgibacillus kekensis]|uniref:Peptidoglycan DD-metalloendopeptidase family protein n=1 Tax=Virgibacillus kekensis TaxID=202261 RepID=A0ABV9DI37_9BACI
MQNINGKAAVNKYRQAGTIHMLKKIIIATFLCLSFTITTAYADDSESLETVYHVYIDGKHIGKVNDKTIIQDYVESLVSDQAKEYEKLSLTPGEEVTYVSEKVFNPSYNNDKVIKTLDEQLSIKAEAVQLTIAGKPAGFFKNQETAKKVIEAYKAKFVDPDVLKRLKKEEKLSESRQKPVTNDASQEALAVGDSIIKDVVLSEKVSFTEKKVNPADILTIDEGLKLLEKGTLEEEIYKVQEGDVLVDIAEKFNLSLKRLLELNKKLTEDSLLQIDQEVHVTDYQPFVDVLVKKETKTEQTLDYEIEIVESDELYKGEEKVRQSGQEGKKQIHYALELKNGNVVKREVLSEKVVKEPVKKVIVKGTKVIPSRGTGELHWPTVGGYVSSNLGMRWGSMHKGMDIAGPSNRAILAADNGTVVSAGWNSGGYGKRIVIDHNNGMRTTYSHLSSISVSPGQTVEKGSRIGTMGATGNSTGVHLHFEVYKNGALQDPQDHL